MGENISIRHGWHWGYWYLGEKMIAGLLIYLLSLLTSALSLSFSSGSPGQETQVTMKGQVWLLSSVRWFHVVLFGLAQEQHLMPLCLYHDSCSPHPLWFVFYRHFFGEAVTCPSMCFLFHAPGVSSTFLPFSILVFVVFNKLIFIDIKFYSTTNSSLSVNQTFG